MQKSKIKNGFTMIELLVVIAVIGILAVAVLAAINPIEQIRKGRDTGTRSDSAEFLGAVERYDASLGYFPWTTGANDTDIDVTWCGLQGGAGCTAMDDHTQDEVVQALVDTAEVKASYKDRVMDPNKSREIFAYYRATPGDSVYACFNPQSYSFAKEAGDDCTVGLAPDAPSAQACPTDCQTDLADTNYCYICLP